MTAQNSLPFAIASLLLQDAQERDLVTARRSALIGILLKEQVLTREQLLSRVEIALGRNCFGKKAWEDSFYRDMRFVKKVFSRTGFDLKYSRQKGRSGYYLEGQPKLDQDLVVAIQGALAELDDRQLYILRNLTPAQKFRQASSMIDLGRKVSGQRT